MSDFYDNMNNEEMINDPGNSSSYEANNIEEETTSQVEGETVTDTEADAHQPEPEAPFDPIPKEKTKKKRKSSGFMKKIFKMAAYGLVFGLVAGAAFTGINYGLGMAGFSANSQKEVSKTNTVSSSSGKQSDLSVVATNVLPSIVSITGTFQTTSYGFFGESSQESQGSGSGIIVSKDKKYIYIATNNHVVENASSLAVGFCDDSTIEATIKGTDADADLAVLTVPLSKVDTKTLDKIKVITLGDSEKLVVGEQAIAIGNALGYGQSVTGGYISALNREYELTDKTMTLIQTDAAINPGNSGGALLDSSGRLIGINTVKFASEEVEGMGYAIPINTAYPIIKDLISAKKITKAEEAYLGVSGRDISSDMAQAYDMPSGIYISEVLQNSPAQKAGIQAGDIIVGFDGKSVSSMESLQNQIAKKTAGTKVTVKVKRQSQMGGYDDKSISVTLGNKSQMETNE